MGAKSSEDEEWHSLSLSGKPKAINYVFPNISTTATMCLLMLSTLAEGTSKLTNAACEPEIVMLADFLNTCGAHITGAGTPVIMIEGIESYPEREIAFTNIPDRVETGSFLLMAAATKSNLTVTHCNPDHQAVILDTLERMGVSYKVGPDSIAVSAPKHLKAVNIKTHEYPGFPTDLQAPMVVALTQAEGNSIVFETIFEGRMFWVEDLKLMDAKVKVLDAYRASIDGPCELRGREVRSPDLRAGMAYVIAALVAKGKSVIHDVEIIDRGYERIEKRLKTLGADIERVA